ncbi:MAG: aminotransferase class I/II-fold pyridoxal phosphate-dependent enzyme [Oscillospiraceae bacterium]|nr:aminotransferase class I/II-fold pyridoxal phosphate-dependent enzyme [Oscillospiraceae bacterium]
MLKPYTTASKEELSAQLSLCREKYEKLSAMGLKLNMARGKPGAKQLDIVSDLVECLDKDELFAGNVDARNYGELMGLDCAREYFADVLGCRKEEVLAGGNASLELMYNIISTAYTHGLNGFEKPWCRLEKIKWLCPAPGYDRHFKITEHFGFELITVPMTSTGPDMDMVEELVKDEAVKGMWCVPKYSNPDGIVYSDETIRRIASLRCAAPDFVLMWDNAYCIHEFARDFVPFVDIVSLCRECGNPNMVYEFASTSKVTFPGAGISAMACSEENLRYYQKILSIRTIGYNKINQLMHVRYLKNKAHTLELMKKHAEVLAPKFECVLRHLENDIAPTGIARWEKPEGGYFVSVFTEKGLAKRTLELCKNAGVVMTGAGATYPYGVDPDDSNIRIAPSYPELDELEKAMEIFCLCMRIAALEKLSA